jgi:hypothetical protein
MPSWATAVTFAPVADGSARDNSPQTGEADALSSGGFVSNVNGTQYRAIKEFDISSLAGATVVGATLRGTVGPNNSFDSGERGHRFEMFAGDGVLDLGDYSAAADEVGTLSHPSGGRTDHAFDVTNELGALVSSNVDFAGVRVSPINVPQGFDVAYDTVLDVFAVPAGSSLASLTPAVEARGFYAPGVQGVQDAGPSMLAYDRTSGTDDRAIMEFDLGVLPSNAMVTAAWIELDVNLITSTEFTFPEPLFYGYTGNGAAEPDDAGETGWLLGQAPEIKDLGLWRIDLNTMAVQAVVESGGSHFGLLAVGGPNHHQFGFRSSQVGSFSEPPRLQLSYSVPPIQSADYNGDGAVDAADYTVWRDTLGSMSDFRADGTNDGHVGPEDYALWKSQFGTTTAPEIANGDFSSGDLTGWEIVVTPNGSQFGGFPRVESFDVDGDGTSSLAFRTGVGQQSIDFDNPAGAGVAQDVEFSTGGNFLLTADLAAQSLSSGSNAGPGRFEMRFDGELVDVVDLNVGPGIDSGEVLRETLSATLVGVTPGTHHVEFLILRPYTLGSAIYQYLDNIQISASPGAAAVPEPGTLVSGALGLLVVSLVPGRRRRTAAVAAYLLSRKAFQLK